jgi:hypothetical protein
MTAVPCGAPPCCTIVVCTDPFVNPTYPCNFKNYGRFYSAPTTSLTAASIAGLVVGLVFLFIILPVILGFGYKRYKTLRAAALARAAPNITQTNPVVLVVGAPMTTNAVVVTKWV